MDTFIQRRTTFWATPSKSFLHDSFCPRTWDMIDNCCSSSPSGKRWYFFGQNQIPSVRGATEHSIYGVLSECNEDFSKFDKVFSKGCKAYCSFKYIRCILFVFTYPAKAEDQYVLRSVGLVSDHDMKVQQIPSSHVPSVFFWSHPSCLLLLELF